MKGHRAAALLLLILAACSSPTPAPTARDDERDARIATLEAQLASAPAIERQWERYFQELARINQHPVELPEMFLSARTEQEVYDGALVKRILDPANRGPGARGPLATILDVARQLRERGIDFLVMPVPPRSAVYPELIAPDLVPVAPDELPPLLDVKLRRFYAELERNGVEVLDLLPTFLAERNGEGPPIGRRRLRRPEILYMRQDPHWSPYATRVAGRVLSQRIKRYSWYTEVAAQQGRAHVSTTWLPVRQFGVTALQMSQAGRFVLGENGQEKFLRCVSHVDGELWSHDDRSSPILLLGDSYLEPSWGLRDDLLRRLQFRLDVITVLGGYQSGQLRALRLRGNGLSGKRLVIWEFCSYSLGSMDAWVPAELEGPRLPDASP